MSQFFFSISLNNSSMAFGIQCAHTHFPHHKECTNEIIEIALAGVIYTRYVSWSFPNGGAAAVAYLSHTHVSYFQMNVLLLVRLPTQCKQISHTYTEYTEYTDMCHDICRLFIKAHKKPISCSTCSAFGFISWISIFTS